MFVGAVPQEVDPSGSYSGRKRRQTFDDYDYRQTESGMYFRVRTLIFLRILPIIVTPLIIMSLWCSVDVTLEQTGIGPCIVE